MQGGQTDADPQQVLVIQIQDPDPDPDPGPLWPVVPRLQGTSLACFMFGATKLAATAARGILLGAFVGKGLLNGICQHLQ
jgi:hypothetical protein